MKQIILSIITLLALNSCNHTFVPCHSDMDPRRISTELMPVDRGNKWTFKKTEYDFDGNPIDTNFRDIEIGGIDTIYYKDDDLDKQYLPAYRVLRDGSPVIFYYLKCEKGAIWVEEYGYSPKEIFLGRTIPDDVYDGWVDPRDESIEWKGPVTVEVPAGTFECWVCEYVPHRQQKWIYKEYYSKGTGLIKVEELNRKYRILATLELTRYDLGETMN